MSQLNDCCKYSPLRHFLTVNEMRTVFIPVSQNKITIIYSGVPLGINPRRMDKIKFALSQGGHNFHA